MINIIEPRFFEEEKQALLEILESRQITRGKWTQRFQEEFASYLGVEHVYSVCSGTVALFIALKALGVEGQRVVVPALSFMATIDAVLLAGGIPVVVDVDEYYTMDPGQLEDAVKRYRPKVAIAVHLYGQTADMESIMYLSEKYGFYVLEDAAQAHGAEFKGKKAGSIGHMAAFSFYASKNVPMGEGGAIAVKDEKLANEVKKWIDFGEHPAFNVRITEFQAAIGSIQLKYLDERNKARRAWAQIYNQAFKNHFAVPTEREGAYHVYHLYTLRHPERDKIIQDLKRAGIDSRVYYTYLLSELRNAEHLPLDRAEKFRREVFSIPVHPYLTEEQVDYIIQSVLATVEVSAG
ncbi:DegT/DnrJ/EryC1/StrS family aminotransferase [Thermocrinis minervae]|uniref:dTDP-4-amino-4,6-dideoxygalactose transaminase n=1 Tax=Thermocrinis minervae TaxID=381751 RepID=A0A1M6Q6F9_9AQUI|nr:DegT/DnrJ/EryC1/StrS family aminotransferase [Thermocrinis minervae]SHK15869.1 dTDP-4-amino-4,6-dideoxygalactose transaminase [Thermocrinis minervae]